MSIHRHKDLRYAGCPRLPLPKSGKTPKKTLLAAAALLLLIAAAWVLGLALTYYWILFRAEGESARVTVMDWASEEEPGGPEGQQLIFNFLQVHPYFEI